MLSAVLFMTLVCSGRSLVNYGKDFITTFPENIAFYHTQDSWNTLQITAFYHGTQVHVTINNTNVCDKILNSGQTQNVRFPVHAGKYRATPFLHAVRVVSSRWVVVLWRSQRGDSVQTNVVPPTENLGQRYFIPALDYSEMVGLYNSVNLSANTTHNAFRLILINAVNVNNDVRVCTAGVRETNLSLNPYQIHQVSTNGSEVTVSSSEKVAVLLTHPCVETPGCGCNLVVTQVLPNNLWGEKFVIPSLRNAGSTWLHVKLSSKVTFRGLDLHQDPPLVSFPYLQEESQFLDAQEKIPLRVVSQGFIFEVIPESSFAACYLVQLNSSEAEVVVVAEKGQKNDVHIDGDSLSSAYWKLTNSKYSSASVSLTGTHVIWHPNSKIAVYMFERMENGSLYGGAAVPLSDVADPDGCVVEPASFLAGTDLMTWPESHQYCLNATYQLATPNSPAVQSKLVDLLQKEAHHGDVWIGLRRCLLTLDWYWQAGNESLHNVSYTVWAAGQPDVPQKAMCASGHLDPNGHFSWRSLSCCNKTKPICYRSADTFTHISFTTLDDVLFTF